MAVFGIFGTETADVASSVYYGLYALQHRGQASSGIVVNDDGVFHVYKDSGLVNEVFTPNVLKSLGVGQIAVGNVRYGTADTKDRINAEPIVVNHSKGKLAMSLDGKLVNSAELKREMEMQGLIFHTGNDAEIISAVIIKERITSVLDQLLMKWISKEGKDMFNLQANAFDISKGIQEDLNNEIMPTGLAITGFNVMSFNYPEEVQRMLEKSASHSMVGDMDRYSQISMIDAMASGKTSGGGTASDMTGMMMGMKMAEKMMGSMNNMSSNNNNMNQSNFAGSAPASNGGAKPNFCPNCGAKTGGANFCSNCGQRL